MQSTPNTVGNLPVRPKIGRPPQLPPAPLPEDVLTEDVPSAAPAIDRRDPRLLVFSVCLVLAMTLVLSRVIMPSINNEMAGDIPAIPPIVVNAPEVSYVAAPTLEEPALVGTLTTIGKEEQAEAATGAEAPAEAPKPSIDNKDRERLLSILSKN